MMRLCPVAGAIAFLAFSLFGCGSAKPAAQKPAKPDAPTAAATAPIAWGQAVDGLQVGLLALGSRDGSRTWDLDYMVCPDPAHRPGQIKERKICPECGRNDLWTPRERLCRECASRLRCCACCRKPFVPGSAFIEGESIILEVRLKNTGPEDISLYGDFMEPCQWDIVFTPADKSAPRKAVHPPLHASYLDINILKGRDYAAHLHLFLKYGEWTFEDARALGPGEAKGAPLKALPPGKYRVTISNKWASQKADGEWKESRLSAGPVEVEIKPKVGEEPAEAGPKISEQRAREIALAAATEKWPDWRTFHNWKLYGDRVLSAPLLTADGKLWQVSFRAHNGEVGYFADMAIDAETGKVTEFKVRLTE